MTAVTDLSNINTPQKYVEPSIHKEDMNLYEPSCENDIVEQDIIYILEQTSKLPKLQNMIYIYLLMTKYCFIVQRSI